MAGADSEHSKCLLAPRAPGVSACALPIRAARPGIPSGNRQCPLLPVGIMTLHSGRPGRLGGLHGKTRGPTAISNNQVVGLWLVP